MFLLFRKNEFPPHETLTATSTPSLNKEGTQAQPGDRILHQEEAGGLRLSEKEEAIY